MLDFRNFDEEIKETVRKLNEEDRNWKWSVKYVGKKKIRIYWEYLEYCGSRNPFFTVEYWKLGEFITIAGDDGTTFDPVFMVSENPNPHVGCEQSYLSGIRSAIEEIGYIAHSRY